MAIRKRGRTPLACAVWLGLFAVPQAMAQTLVVTDGTTSTVDGQTYDGGINTYIDGAAVRAENAGSKVVGTNINAKTGGEYAPGVAARFGGEVDLTDLTVTTAADGAIGVHVNSAGVVLRNGTVSTDGLSATGIELMLSSNATIDNVDFTAQRAIAARVVSQSTLTITNSALTGTTGIVLGNTGSNVTATNVDVIASTAHGVISTTDSRATLSGGTVTAQGASGNGLVADTGGNIIAKDGIVVTTRGGAAANASSGASITFDDATLRTTEGGMGIFADGAGTIVDADAVTIEANGSGVRAVAGSQVTLTASDVSSATSYGIVANGATLEVSGGSVAAAGSDYGISGEGASMLLDGGVVVSSRLSHAVVVQGGTLDVDDATLRSTESGDGLVVTGATANLANARIESASRYGVRVLAGQTVVAAADVTLTNVDVDAGVNAIYMNARNAFDGSTSVTGGTLRAANATVLADTPVGTAGTNRLLLSNGAQLHSDSGLLIEVNDIARLAATFDAVDLTGNLRANGTGALDVAFRNSASLRGNVESGGAFDLGTGTMWTLPGDSNVGSLTHAGTIAFNDPAAFHTLTVRGDYTGTGGTLALNTQLADDVAGSDRLHVIGDTSGSTQLVVTNRGGAGALTNADGIRVVQVDGQSDGTFALTGRVVGGAYDYLLHQGGVANPSDGDWYLRSELTPPPPPPPPVDPPPVDPPPVDPPPVDPPPVDPPPVDPPPVDPPPVDPPPVDPPPVDPPPVDPPVDPPPVDPPPVDPPPTDPPPTEPPPHIDPIRPPHAPVYRPEVGAYLANQQAAQTVFRQRRDDRGVSRVGGVERTAWVRALHNDHRGITGGAQIETEAQANGLEIGSQFGAWEVGDGLVSVGASLGRADIGTREVSNATRYFAFGDVRGDAVTAFATWLGSANSPHGLSLDVWMQRADFEMEVRGQGLAIERYDARATSVSLETGYAFQVVGMADRALYFEPQFQVVHTDYDMDAHVEANGTVARSVADGGLAGRAALRLFGDIVGMRPFVEIGARYNDTRQAIAFDGAVLDLDLAPVVYETTGGLSVEFGEGWRAWGSVSGRRADTTREVEGQFGVGYRW